MKNINDIKGLTLMEVIVALTIIAILATIAIPNLFSNVNKSRTVEAIGAIASLKPRIEACIIQKAKDNLSNLCTQPVLWSNGMSSSPSFIYTVTGPSSGVDTSYSIVATGQGALKSTDTITVSRSAATWPNFGTVTCSFTGTLSGTC